MQNSQTKRIVVAITGASGIPYAESVIKMLLKANCQIFCAISNTAKIVAKQEMDIDLQTTLQNIGVEKIYQEDDFYAPMASGSFYFDAMAIVPCSMKTLGKIANGIGDNLIVRAAEVALKEHRRLVIVPREAPFATTHLKNMFELSQYGAVILPASPAFYHKPQKISDLIDFVASRIVASLGIKQDFLKEWGYEKEV